MYKNLIEMFRENEGKGAVGAFNLHCFEMLPAMIAAAQELGTPIIIQTSLGTAEYIGFEALIAAVIALAKKADINVCLHMDHCKSIEALKKAIDLGYSSVMYDGSDLPLEENIKNLASVTTMLDAGKTPEEMLGVLLEGMDLEVTDTLPVEFSCNCSKDRVRKALISIGREELQSMIDDGKEIEVNCHFCTKNYNFTVDDLKEMILD